MLKVCQRRRGHAHGQDSFTSLATEGEDEATNRISAERKAEVATREEARKAILKSLELNMLKGGWDSDDKDAYLEVASLEVAAKEAHEGRSLSHANVIISKLGGKTFSVPR